MLTSGGYGPQASGQMGSMQSQGVLHLASGIKTSSNGIQRLESKTLQDLDQVIVSSPSHLPLHIRNTCLFHIASVSSTGRVALIVLPSP